MEAETDPMRPAAMDVREFLSGEGGQDLIEYALLAGLVAVAAGAVITPMGTPISTIFSKAMSVLEKYS